LHVSSEHVFVSVFNPILKFRETSFVNFTGNDLAAFENSRADDRPATCERIEDCHAREEDRFKHHLVNEFEGFGKWVGLKLFIRHSVHGHMAKGHRFGQAWRAFLHNHNGFIGLGWVDMRGLVFARVRLEPEQVPIKNREPNFPPPVCELFLMLLGEEEHQIGIVFEHAIGTLEERLHLLDVLIYLVGGFHLFNPVHVFEQGHVDAVGDVCGNDIDRVWSEDIVHEINAVHVKYTIGELDHSHLPDFSWGSGDYRGSWLIGAELDGDNAGRFGGFGRLGDGEEGARDFSFGCHCRLLGAKEDDLLGLVQGLGIPDFLVFLLEEPSDDEAVLDVGVGGFDKVAGSAETPFFLALGSHSGFLMVNRVDAEGDVLPTHFLSAHVFIELDHELHCAFEFLSAGDGDFSLAEELVGFESTLTGDEFVVFGEENGVDGTDEEERIADVEGVFGDLFRVFAETLVAVDLDFGDGEIFDSFETFDFAWGSCGCGHGNEKARE